MSVFEADWHKGQTLCGASGCKVRVLAQGFYHSSGVMLLVGRRHTLAPLHDSCWRVSATVPEVIPPHLPHALSRRSVPSKHHDRCLAVPLRPRIAAWLVRANKCTRGVHTRAKGAAPTMHPDFFNVAGWLGI